MTAKCNNYTGCLMAYRGEEIQIAPGAPMVCPECGKPVVPSGGGAANVKKIIPIAVAVLVVLGGAIFVVKALGGKKGGGTTESPTPAMTEATPAITPRAETAEPSTTTPSTTTPSTSDAQVAAEPIKPEVHDPVKEAASQQSNEVRQAVLRRIDVMPNLTPANREKLRTSVYKARTLGMILTIPFTANKVSLTNPDIAALKNALESPEIQKLRDDATAVFVVLGYADSKGDEEKNRAISQKRADAVVNAMRDKCNVGNVTHAVGMGGSTMMDTGSLDKNRIVEIWAAQP